MLFFRNILMVYIGFYLQCILACGPIRLSQKSTMTTHVTLSVYNKNVEVECNVLENLIAGSTVHFASWFLCDENGEKIGDAIVSSTSKGRATSNNYNISDDYGLIFKNINEKVGRCYQCLIVTTNTGNSIKGNVNVKITNTVPKIPIIEPNRKKVFECSSVKFECKRPNNSLSCDVKWYKDRKPLEESRVNNYYQENGTLHIDNVIAENGGHYQCEIPIYGCNYNNETIISGMAILEIEAKENKVPTVKPNQQEVAENKNATFECELPEGSGSCKVRWYKDGKTLEKSSANTYQQRGTMLYIMKVRAENRGQYKCETYGCNYNNKTSMSNTANLQVKENFDYLIVLYIFIGLLTGVIVFFIILYLCYTKPEMCKGIQDKISDRSTDTAVNSKDIPSEDMILFDNGEAESDGNECDEDTVPEKEEYYNYNNID